MCLLREVGNPETQMIRDLVILAMIAFIGCDGETVLTLETGASCILVGPQSPLRPAVDEVPRACSIESDCAVVRTSCCGCGTAVAVNGDFERASNASFCQPPTNCSFVIETCPKERATCLDGRCVICRLDEG